MLTLVSKLYVGLIKGLAVLAALLIVVSIAMVVVDVSARALGRGSFRATIAVVEYILLYFTLLSAPYLLHTRGHVLVDMAIKALPVWPRRILEAAIYLLGMTVCTIFAYQHPDHARRDPAGLFRRTLHRSAVLAALCRVSAVFRIDDNRVRQIPGHQGQPL
jgi:TRAP-type C4-dicarboxylate transport system permease small subunit